MGNSICVFSEADYFLFKSQTEEKEGGADGWDWGPEIHIFQIQCRALVHLFWIMRREFEMHCQSHWIGWMRLGIGGTRERDELTSWSRWQGVSHSSRCLSSRLDDMYLDLWWIEVLRKVLRLFWNSIEWDGFGIERYAWLNDEGMEVFWTDFYGDWIATLGFHNISLSYFYRYLFGKTMLRCGNMEKHVKVGGNLSPIFLLSVLGVKFNWER